MEGGGYRPIYGGFKQLESRKKVNIQYKYIIQMENTRKELRLGLYSLTDKESHLKKRITERERGSRDTD